MRITGRGSGVYLVILIYSLLAAALLLLAYPPPDYSGVLVRQGEVVHLSPTSLAVVRLEEGRTVVLRNGLSLNVSGKVCSLGDHVHVLSADSILSVSLSAREVKRLRLPLALYGADIHCSSDDVFVSGIGEGALKVFRVSASDGRGEAVTVPLSSPETRVRGEGERLFVALDSSLVEVSREGVFLYELVPDMRTSGIAFYRGSPVVFGKRGSAALIYWLGEAKAIEVEIAGRESSVDALLCEGYWCRAVVVPFGDWLRVLEFKEWRYVRDVKIVGTRGFVYGGAGASEKLWFRGRLVETGSVAVEVGSTGRAVIGAGREGYFMAEEGLPRPRLYDYKVPPVKKAAEARRETVALPEERVKGDNVSLSYQKLGPLTDLLRGVFTAITLLGPLAAYLIRKLCC